MPLRLNVGASRKVTDNNYGSRGATVNLELELDTALASDPPKLQEKIRHLFGLARTALQEELNGHGHRPAPNGDVPPSLPAANGDARNGGARTTGPRRSTPSQCKALHAIARAHGVNLFDYLRDRFHVGGPDELTIRQASEAIDDFKAAEVEAGAGP
jgi:hypothetical protein